MAEGTQSEHPPYRRVTLRFKWEEWAQIEQDIDTAGVSMNEYFRQLAVDAPVPRKKHRVPANDDAKVVRQFVGQMGKIGSNLNQLAYLANAGHLRSDETMKPSHAAIAASCKALEDMMAEVTRTLMGLKVEDDH